MGMREKTWVGVCLRLIPEKLEKKEHVVELEKRCYNDGCAIFLSAVGSPYCPQCGSSTEHESMIHHTTIGMNEFHEHTEWEYQDTLFTGDYTDWYMPNTYSASGFEVDTCGFIDYSLISDNKEKWLATFKDDYAMLLKDMLAFFPDGAVEISVGINTYVN